MQIQAKFYNSTGSYLEAPIEDVVEIEQDMLSFGTANFAIGIYNAIEEDQKVELYEVDSVGVDKLVFTGYIYTITPIRKQFGKVNIELRDEKAKFDYLISEGVNFGTPTTVNARLTELFDEFPTYGQTITFSTDVTGNINTVVNAGDTLSSVLDEFCKQFGVYWTVKDNHVSLVSEPGIDRTSGSNYQEARFNGLHAAESNIKSVSSVTTGKRINVLLAKNPTGTSVISKYSGTFHGMGVAEFRDGDLSTKGQAYLDDADRNKRTFTFEIEPNTIIADVGDKIKVIIENTNQYFDINASCFVTNKKISYNGGKEVTYQFQEFPTITMTTENFNRYVSKQLQFIKIK